MVVLNISDTVITTTSSIMSLHDYMTSKMI